MKLEIKADFQTLIPPLTKEEYSELETSILTDGCRDAICIWGETIVDGHNRYEICMRHEISYHTSELSFNTDVEAKVWIIKNQFARRNLTLYDRSVLALNLELLFKEKAKQNLKSPTGGKKGMTLQNSGKSKVNTEREMAAVAGVSHDTIFKVRIIEAKGTKHQKELIKSGKSSVNKIFRLIKSKEEKEERKNEYEKMSFPKSDDGCRLILGDFRDKASEIVLGSIDAVIVDPPYGKDYLSIYEDLAQVSARVLKLDGCMLVMCGQSYLPEIMAAMTKHLKYQWMIAYLTPDKTTKLWNKGISSYWKPVLIFSIDEKYSGGWANDVIQAGADKGERLIHEWGQNEEGMAEIVKRFTKPGETVCDLMMGSATTGVACLRLKRKFIGIEIDKVAFVQAEMRLSEVINKELGGDG